MKAPLCIYSIARCYIEDNATVLGPDLVASLLGRVRARDLKGLACIDGDFSAHSYSTNVIRVLRQIAAFFKKNSDFVDDTLCTAAALASFERGERLCRITNRRLDHYFFHRDRLDPDVEIYVNRAEAWISQVLGSYDTFFDRIPSLLRVTSGATAQTARADSLPYLKLRRRVECTPACRPYLEAAYQFFGYAKPRVREILWNRVEFVPKSWKTYRSIACEPSGNLPFQLAFDAYVKKRLRRKTKINLSSQEQNQHHAYIGSLAGKIATIDLSMASDTVSLGTVGWLIPTDWYSFLSDMRSPCFRFGKSGVMRKYAKFSSMGNGATFALETLIFASFLHAVGSKCGLAYGDDLTVEVELVPALLKLLKFFGFVPNVEKSYYTGLFRESCGKDYHMGVDITPFYVRSTAAWDLPNACHNVNGLAKVSPHGAVWGYLKSFITTSKLPFSAVSYDTMSGVHLHPHFAYRRRLIRTGNPITGDRWSQYTKANCRKTSSQVCRDSRTLFLWFLRKQATEGASESNGANALLQLVAENARYVELETMKHTIRAATLSESEATRYTISSQKFTRKWVSWIYPAMGLSEDSFSFSEFVTRES